FLEITFFALRFRAAHFSCCFRNARPALPPLAANHSTTFRQSHPPFRAALSFQLVHQQLFVLRIFPRQRDFARNAFGGGSRSRGARFGAARFSEYSSRRG